MRPIECGLSRFGAAPVELPVFSDTNAFLEQLKEYRRRELGRPENAGAEALPLQATDEEMQFIKLQTPDGKVIVLPIPRQSNFLQ